MAARKLSELQLEYRSFFRGKLKKYGVKSQSQLSKQDKSAFFTEIKLDWAKFKEDKKKTSTITQRKVPKTTVINTEDKGYIEKHRKTQKPTQFYGEGKTHPKSIKVIESEQNSRQTDELRILYKPINIFEQVGLYKYPVVKMPKDNSLIKLPRTGRSNQKGYTEPFFLAELRKRITNIQIDDNVHMVIPNFNKPYEPDIVLYDEKINLYVDIEIDEPYDGYYRYPTHCIKPEDVKQDDIRDLFFRDSGWVVIRFTEKQIFCQSSECIAYIQNVINSLYGRASSNDTECEREPQWDYNQCVQWQKINYRETYLGITKFNKHPALTEIHIDVNEVESIESKLSREELFKSTILTENLAFDEKTHKYMHPKDKTGNAEYISVTTLIERFFPFDLERYISKKSLEEGRDEEEVLKEYSIIRDEASSKGTSLHNNIEKFLKDNDVISDDREFGYFIDFYNQEIKRRNLTFYDAEKPIFSDDYRVAGTIDSLFKKENSSDLVMLDWKRSKKLIIDGRPKKYGYGYGLSELKNIDNSSYYKYCLQQNIYKYILEKEYSLKVSSMQLVVLHQEYSKYHVVNVPDMKTETEAILNSLKYKI